MKLPLKIRRYFWLKDGAAFFKSGGPQSYWAPSNKKIRGPAPPPAPRFRRLWYNWITLFDDWAVEYPKTWNYNYDPLSRPIYEYLLMHGAGYGSVARPISWPIQLIYLRYEQCPEYPVPRHHKRLGEFEKEYHFIKWVLGFLCFVISVFFCFIFQSVNQCFFFKFSSSHIPGRGMEKQLRQTFFVVPTNLVDKFLLTSFKPCLHQATCCPATNCSFGQHVACISAT